MNPNAFYLALKETIENSENEEVKNIFSCFGFDEESKNSYIKGDNSIIFPIKIEEGKNSNRLKDKIVEFIDNNKKLICRNYCKQTIEGKPDWIKEIERFYTDK